MPMWDHAPSEVLTSGPWKWLDDEFMTSRFPHKLTSLPGGTWGQRLQTAHWPWMAVEWDLAWAGEMAPVRPERWEPQSSMFDVMTIWGVAAVRPAL